MALEMLQNNQKLFLTSWSKQEIYLKQKVLAFKMGYGIYPAMYIYIQTIREFLRSLHYAFMNVMVSKKIIAGGKAFQNDILLKILALLHISCVFD